MKKLFIFIILNFSNFFKKVVYFSIIFYYICYMKEKLITQCCIKTCNKFEWPKNNWLSKKIYNSKIQKYLLRKIFNLFTEWKEESPDPQSTNISHTYCPVCFKKAMREIKNL